MLLLSVVETSRDLQFLRSSGGRSGGSPGVTYSTVTLTVRGV